MKRKTIEQTILEMLKKNTGSHMLDSGGAYGRNWQRNEKLTIAALKKQPSATLEIRKCDDGSIECSPTVSVYHKLVDTLSLDDLCHAFNSMEVPDWDSEIYGVSAEGESWIKSHFEIEGEAFNTYNWESNLSQVLQGQALKHTETGDDYILIQIHGGCDVRGGYTDAKLFKIEAEGVYGVLSDDCMFPHVDWMGEWIAHSGSSATDEDFKALAKEFKVRKGQTKTINGAIASR